MLLSQEKVPSLFLYEQDFMDFTTLGLLSELSIRVLLKIIQDYQSNLIKKHEKTLRR